LSYSPSDAIACLEVWFPVFSPTDEFLQLRYHAFARLHEKIEKMNERVSGICLVL